MHQRADAIRKRIEPTVVKRAPQLMVKVTGGGRGMLAIAAHFRYISKNGRLGMENELGERPQGRSEPPRGGSFSGGGRPASIGLDQPSLDRRGHALD